MTEAPVDFYEVLGVPRSADGKAVRKAYFAKVREFPPETHPEEFKRVREAYETIGNPSARGQYDATLAGGGENAEATEQLHAALAAWQAGDAPRAEKTLTQLLLARPDLTIARLLLARVFVAGGKVKQALPIFDALCKEDAGNPLHHLHHGHAWRTAGDLDRALAAYRRAYQLDRTDPELLLAVADCLIEKQEYEPALAELDRGVQLDGKIDFEDLGYFLRKLQIQYLRARPELAEKELEQILAVLPGDLPTRRYVASRLLAIAAGLFARKQAPEAQALIAWCRKIDPTRKSLKMELPITATIEISRLPTAARAWLRDTAKAASDVITMPGPKKRWVVLAALYVWFSLSSAFGVQRSNDPAGKLANAVTIVVAALVAGWLVERARQRWRSPYGAFLALHPFHLVRCNHDEVTLWPLLNLTTTSVLHQSANGSYTHSLLTFEFGGTKFRFDVQGQALAESLGQRALDQRRRLLDLMAANELEREKGYELFPPALLEARDLESRARERTRRSRARLAITAVAGLILFALSLPYNRRATERQRYREAEAGGIPAQREYLRLYPDGKYADAVRTLLGIRYDNILAAYRGTARSDAPGISAVVALLGQLRDGPSSDVAIEYQGVVDLDGASLAAGVIDPRPAFDQTSTRGREEEITVALRTALALAIPQEALRLIDPGRVISGTAASPPAATFLIRYRIAPSGATYVEQQSGKQLVGIAFDWTFLVRAGTDGAELATLSLHSNPAERIRYSVAQDERSDSILPYTKMSASGFGDFHRRLVAQLGIGPEPRDEVSDPERGRAPAPVRALSPGEEAKRKIAEALRERGMR